MRVEKKRTGFSNAVFSAIDSISFQNTRQKSKKRPRKIESNDRELLPLLPVDSLGMQDLDDLSGRVLFRSLGPRIPTQSPVDVRKILHKHGITTEFNPVPGMLKLQIPDGSCKGRVSNLESIPSRVTGPPLLSNQNEDTTQASTPMRNTMEYSKRPKRPSPKIKERESARSSTDLVSTPRGFGCVERRLKPLASENDVLVQKTLASMHKETLEDEVARLVEENSKLVKSLAMCEQIERDTENRLLELTHRVEVEERHFAELVETSEQLTGKLENIRAIVATNDDSCADEMFRARQLQKIYRRTLDDRNLAKQTTEAISHTVQTCELGNLEETQQKVREIEQERDHMRADIIKYHREIKAERAVMDQRLLERRKLLGEFQQLKAIQQETAIRRKSIVLQIAGDLSKRQEHRLRQTSLLMEKRRSAAGGVLASLTVQVSKYEHLMKRLQQTTNIKDMASVAERFFSQETKRIRLDKEIVIATEKRDHLKSRLDAGTAKLHHLREYGVEVIGEVHDFGSLEQQLRDARGSMRYKHEKLRETFRLSISLISGLLPIARQLFIPVPTTLYNPLRIEELSSPQYVSIYSKSTKTVLNEILRRLLLLVNDLVVDNEKDGESEEEDELIGSETAVASKLSTGFSKIFSRSATQVPSKTVPNFMRTKTRPSRLSITEEIASPQISFQSPKSPFSGISKSLHNLAETKPIPNDPNIRVKPKADSPILSPTRSPKKKATSDAANSSSPIDALDPAQAEVQSPLSNCLEEMSNDEEATEELSPGNCFAFFRSGYTDGNEEFVKLIMRQARFRGEDKFMGKQQLVEHNKRLFEIIGKDRFNVIQPEAIDAKDLYKNYMKGNGMKEMCFSREEAKVVSQQLLVQDMQSKTHREGSARTLDIKMRQSAVLSGRLSRPSLSLVEKPAVQSIDPEKLKTKDANRHNLFSSSRRARVSTKVSKTPRSSQPLNPKRPNTRSDRMRASKPG